MRKFLKPSILPLFTLICGILGLLLRAWLFFGATDQKGLLVSAHPANALTFILTAVVLAGIFLYIRPLDAVDRYQQLFPGTIFPAIGYVVAAAGIVLVSLQDLFLRQDTITILSLVLGILAASSLLILAWHRFRQTRPVCYFHVIVTVYLMFHLISQYRLWSAEPQLQFYFFPLLASVFLMLTGYHNAVLDSRKSSRRWFVLCNQGALYCCCLSLWGDRWLFYLTMGVWMLSSLCSLDIHDPEKPTEEV